jgi:hypothetical protein
MINKSNTQFEQVISATCDCCNESIKVNYGSIEDHVKIGGYQNGQILEAIVCIKCMEEKLSFINIKRKDNTLGYC